MKSLRCNGNRASSAASRSSVESDRMSRSISARRSPRNMCSVRHRPMPCAPSLRARFASSGVSALARTPEPAALVGVHQHPVDGPHQLRGFLVGTFQGFHALLDVGLHRGGHDRHRADEHLAGRAVDADLVALVDDHRCRRVIVLVSTSMSSSSAPQTQVLPMPRATTAACEVLPPRAVRMPLAAIMPPRSSGLVSLRTSSTCSPLAGPFHRGGGVEDDPAHRRARGRGHALGEQLADTGLVELREHQQRQLGAGDPVQAPRPG